MQFQCLHKTPPIYVVLVFPPLCAWWVKKPSAANLAWRRQKLSPRWRYRLAFVPVVACRFTTYLSFGLMFFTVKTGSHKLHFPLTSCCCPLGRQCLDIHPWLRCVSHTVFGLFCMTGILCIPTATPKMFFLMC